MVTQESTFSSQPAGRTGLTSWIKRYPLLAYSGLAFGLTWPLMLAEVLGSWGLIPFRLTLAGTGLWLVLPLAYGPTIAALLVTGITSGRSGIRTLLSRLLIWRVGWRWYGATLLLPGVIAGGAISLYAVRRGAPVELPALGWEMVLLPVALVVRGLFNGEEIGWRGFALPYLQQRWPALTASLLLGVIWALFHLPIFFVHGPSVLGSQNSMNPFAFLVEVLAGSISITWLLNNTKGSLLIAYLYHAAVNTWTTEIFHVNSIDSAMVALVVALIVVIRYGPERLTRQPQGSQPGTNNPDAAS